MRGTKNKTPKLTRQEWKKKRRKGWGHPSAFQATAGCHNERHNKIGARGS